MKRCHRCRIVYHFNDRLRCLYCDAMLTETSRDDSLFSKPGQTAGGVSDEQSVTSQLLRNRNMEGQQQLQYLISGYFRVRSFHFIYSFSRQEMKMGKEVRRWLIQPLNVSYAVMLPWVAYDLVDSLVFHMLYQGFCDKCGWKYCPTPRFLGHDPDECEYNKEFTHVIKEILTGQITYSEEEIKTKADQKITDDKRSAYYDLCRQKDYLTSMVDWVSVTMSVLFWLFLTVWMLLPLVINVFSRLND